MPWVPEAGRRGPVTRPLAGCPRAERRMSGRVEADREPVEAAEPGHDRAGAGADAAPVAAAGGGERRRRAPGVGGSCLRHVRHRMITTDNIGSATGQAGVRSPPQYGGWEAQGA